MTTISQQLILIDPTKGNGSTPSLEDRHTLENADKFSGVLDQALSNKPSQSKIKETPSNQKESPVKKKTEEKSPSNKSQQVSQGKANTEDSKDSKEVSNTEEPEETDKDAKVEPPKTDQGADLFTVLFSLLPVPLQEGIQKVQLSVNLGNTTQDSAPISEVNQGPSQETPLLGVPLLPEQLTPVKTPEVSNQEASPQDLPETFLASFTNAPLKDKIGEPQDLISILTPQDKPQHPLKDAELVTLLQKESSSQPLELPLVDLKNSTSNEPLVDLKNSASNEPSQPSVSLDAEKLNLGNLTLLNPQQGHSSHTSSDSSGKSFQTIPLGKELRDSERKNTETSFGEIQFISVSTEELKPGSTHASENPLGISPEIPKDFKILHNDVSGSPQGDVQQITQGNVTDQVISGASLSIQAGRKEITLQLKPENLGEVRVNLISGENQQVTARLITNTLEAHEHLQANIAHLKEAMESQGIKVGNLTVVYSGSADSQDTSQSNTASQQDLYQQMSQQQASQQYSQSAHERFSGWSNGNQVSLEDSINPATFSEQSRDGDTTADKGNLNGRISLLI